MRHVIAAARLLWCLFIIMPIGVVLIVGAGLFELALKVVRRRKSC